MNIEQGAALDRKGLAVSGSVISTSGSGRFLQSSHMAILAASELGRWKA